MTRASSSAVCGLHAGTGSDVVRSVHTPRARSGPSAVDYAVGLAEAAASVPTSSKAALASIRLSAS